MVHRVGEGGSNRICDQRTLARTRDARHHGERAELDLGGDVLQVVRLGARDLERAAPRIAALIGKTHHARAREVGSRARIRTGHDLFRRAGAHHLAAVFARTGPHVDHVIRGTNGVLVMLDHDYGIP